MTHENESAVLAELADVAQQLGNMSQKKQDAFTEAVTQDNTAEDNEPPEAPTEPEKSVVVKLDTEDSLRLENLILRQKIAAMSVTLAEKQAAENKNAFQNHLISKLGIDVTKYQLQVNPTDNTVAIVPR